MRIQKKLTQYRRDFQAIYICDHCGNTEESYGYDDANFHENVIPNMKCKICDKKAGESYEPQETKYTEGYQI